MLRDRGGTMWAPQRPAVIVRTFTGGGWMGHRPGRCRWDGGGPTTVVVDGTHHYDM